MSHLRITPYVCPNPGCVGGLTAADGGVDRCLHCSGSGLTDDPMGGAERAPRPPGVMKAACGDCAFRAGSPELEESGARLPEDEPFFCHQGLSLSGAGRYEPVATFNGLPLGAMVCAGWWAMRTSEQLPAAPYRERPITEDQVEDRWGAKARPPVSGGTRAVGGSEPSLLKAFGRVFPSTRAVLQALMDADAPMHTEQAADVAAVSYGVAYSVYMRLETSGWATKTVDAEAGRPRRTYLRLTDQGRELARVALGAPQDGQGVTEP